MRFLRKKLQQAVLAVPLVASIGCNPSTAEAPLTSGTSQATSVGSATGTASATASGTHGTGTGTGSVSTSMGTSTSSATTGTTDDGPATGTTGNPTIATSTSGTGNTTGIDNTAGSTVAGTFASGATAGNSNIGTSTSSGFGTGNTSGVGTVSSGATGTSSVGSTGGTTGAPDAGSWADCDPQTQYFVGGYGCEDLSIQCNLDVTQTTVPASSDLVDARGGIAPDTCQTICPAPYTGAVPLQCHVPVDASGTYETDGGADVVNCYFEGGCVQNGRRPEGFAMPKPQVGLAGFLATSAALEAASVPAFRRMERELAALGAPAELCARARRAAREEIDHARTMRTLAVRRGAAIVPPEIGPERPRSIHEMAMENAIEGCVRETFGAAVALWQSRTARDLELRAAYARIAEDEASHAELSWDVAWFLEARLTPTERAATLAARKAAIRELEGQLASAKPLAHDADAGLPTPEQARNLFAFVTSEIWTTAIG